MTDEALAEWALKNARLYAPGGSVESWEASVAVIRVLGQNRDLRAQVQGHCERIAAQSELLAKRAWKPAAEAPGEEKKELAEKMLRVASGVFPGCRLEKVRFLGSFLCFELPLDFTVDGKSLASKSEDELRSQFHSDLLAILEGASNANGCAGDNRSGDGGSSPVVVTEAGAG